MSERLTRRLLIRGLVQGVWYRETMRREAERLGVTGWVRNRVDGSVEAVVHGDARALEAIVRWARAGPPTARVDAVEALPAEGAFDRFEKRETA